MAGKKIAKKEEAQVPAIATGSWGSENVGTDDIVIPKIQLMQPMSKLVVEDGIAKPGEFRSSLEKTKVLGSLEKGVEFIVFGTFKNRLVFKDGEYEQTESVTPDNADAPREEVVGGSVISRTTVINAYAILAADVPGGDAFPVVVPFKSTGYYAGKTLLTHIKKLQMVNKPSAAKVFLLTCTKETNDKGTFYVPQVDVVRDATNEELAAAYNWYKALASGAQQVVVHDDEAEVEDLSEATPQGATATPAGQQAQVQV